MFTLKEVRAKNSGYKEAEVNFSSLAVLHFDFQKAESSLAKVAGEYSLSKDNDGVALKIHSNYAVALWGVDKTKDASSVLNEIYKREISSVPAILNYANLLVYVEKDKEKAKTVVSRLKYMSEDPTLQKRVKELESLIYSKDGA